jgi:hypothetical protein
MRCPKCQFDHQLQTTECLKCGIVFSRYQQALERAAQLETVAPEENFPEPTSVSPEALATLRNESIKEFKCRLLALPLALLFARLITATGLRMATSMLAMVLHESGHAISAWLTGRWAVPLLWVTMHGDDRSWLIVLILSAAILFGGFVAWKTERWGWVLIAAAALVLQFIFLCLPPQTTIIFGGDGGALVLGTILMAIFYAPRESPLYKSWGLRWGLLVVGAVSFMHVFILWTGPIADIPFGEIEGVGPSDPTLLTEMYGWSVTQLINRYVELGEACLAALAILYAWGLVSTYLEIRRNPSAEKLRIWGVERFFGPAK